MKVIRRVALYVVLPLALAVVAGYSWYRLSDTGKGWRYEDKLATYCDGLIPYEQSVVFTDLDTESGLSFDTDHGTSDLRSNYCKVADIYLTIGEIPDGADNRRHGGSDVFDELRTGSWDTLPMALGSGWHGYTDMESTGIVLTCDNKEASVVVSALADESHASPGGARKVAELVAATAVKAADRWSCEAERGGRIPPLPAPSGEVNPSTAAETCRGIPYADEVHWVKEAKATGTAPLERCVLGETKARDEDLYHLEAAFGPYAQRLRSTPSEAGGLNRDAGSDRNRAWATAKCPGYGPRALFTITTTEYAYPEGDFLRESLDAFAKRSAKQHRCTDLKLPTSTPPTATSAPGPN